MYTLEIVKLLLSLLKIHNFIRCWRLKFSIRTGKRPRFKTQTKMCNETMAWEMKFHRKIDFRCGIDTNVESLTKMPFQIQEAIENRFDLVSENLFFY